MAGTKKSKKAQKIAFYINRTFAVFLVCAAFAFLVFLCAKAAFTQISSSKTVNITNQPPKPTPVYDVLKQLEQNEYTKALETIQAKILYDSAFSEPVRNYFETFYNYLESLINPRKYSCQSDTTYFILNAPIVAEYLQKECHYSAGEAKQLSEVPPYFLIKNYDQYVENRSRLYKSYIDFFTAENSLTQKTADILCLYFKSLYDENKYNQTALKTELSIIQEYCTTTYTYELGENGIYVNQRIYLEKLQTYIMKAVNKKLIWLNFESCPKYML